ncbi:hypothetical protein BCEP4_220084 [Burkholderia cepacia]|nr:hypothetical protein BCEP4_220084 [Burkholderia cepacia]
MLLLCVAPRVESNKQFNSGDSNDRHGIPHRLWLARPLPEGRDRNHQRQRPALRVLERVRGRIEIGAV